MVDGWEGRGGRRAEGRGQRAEGRGQRAEGRGQRAEGRGQRAEGGWVGVGGESGEVDSLVFLVADLNKSVSKQTIISVFQFSAWYCPTFF